MTDYTKEDIEQSKLRLKDLQDQKARLLRSIKTINDKILAEMKIIDSEHKMDTMSTKSKSNSIRIQRDVKICIDFIKDHPNCLTKDLINNINEINKGMIISPAYKMSNGKYVDSNYFSNLIGRFLIDDKEVIAEKTGKTTIWKLITQ